MINYTQSYLVLLVQKIHRIFCFYNISPKTIETFENIYGINSWNNSKTKLTLYYIDNNIPTEKISILTPPFNNNWYFDIEGDNITTYVELSKVTLDNHCEKILSSNIITTPRDHISEDFNIHYIDINNPTSTLDYIHTSESPTSFSTEISDSTSPFLCTSSKFNSDFFIETMRNLNFKDLNSSK